MNDQILENNIEEFSRKHSGRDAVQTVTGADFDRLVVGAHGPVAVEFMSYGCIHCRAIEPVLQTVAELLKSKVKVYRVNLPLNEDLAESYGITGTPTFVMFLNGKEISRVEGPRPTIPILLRVLTQPFEA